MARPRKCKRVCNMPEINTFGPYPKDKGIGDFVEMTVEEFETIRMIDHEGFIQEECAESMGVGRSTVQRIYEDARKKIADSLVNGKILKVQGGDYIVCEELKDVEKCEPCFRNRHRRGSRG